MNKITIGLILIIGTLLIVNSNWFLEIKTEKSNESYVISSGNVIEIGDKYKDGYYDVSYTNKDTKQGGTFGEYDFHSGDVVHGMEYTKGNKISYELNEGYFKLTPTIFKNSITEINKPGNYYLKKDLKKTTYEVCNKGTLNVDTNLGFFIEKNECKTINMKTSLKSNDYLSLNIKNSNEEIESGIYNKNAGEIQLSLKEI